MTKLTKSQLADLDKIANDLSAAFTEVQDAMQAYNDVLTGDLWFAVENSINTYNTLLVDAREIQTEVVSGIEDVIDQKSDKWQESARGEAYHAWKDSWEGIDLNDVECPEQPNPLEFEAEEHHQLLWDAPTELEA